MFPVGGPPSGGRVLVAGDAIGPLSPRRTGLARGIEDTGAQEFGDELQFVGGQSLHETPGLGFMRTIGTRNESGYQSTSQGRTPVCEKSYSISAGIMSKTATVRKGWARRWAKMLTGVIVTGKRDYAV